MAETTTAPVRIGRSMTIDEEIAVMRQDLAELKRLASDVREQLAALEQPAARASHPGMRRAAPSLLEESRRQARPRLTVVAGDGGEG